MRTEEFTLVVPEQNIPQGKHCFLLSSISRSGDLQIQQDTGGKKIDKKREKNVS